MYLVQDYFLWRKCNWNNKTMHYPFLFSSLRALPLLPIKIINRHLLHFKNLINVSVTASCDNQNSYFNLNAYVVITMGGHESTLFPWCENTFTEERRGGVKNIDVNHDRAELAIFWFNFDILWVRVDMLRKVW